MAAASGTSGGAADRATTPWRSLAGFTATAVLSVHPAMETCAILGSIEGNDEKALVVIRRKPLGVHNPAVLAALCSAQTVLTRQQLQNDIYGQYAAQLPSDQNGADVVVVHPATAKEIAKHTEQPVHLVRETPELYRTVVAPAIAAAAAADPGRLRWVWNILDGVAEAERVVYRTPLATVDTAEAFVVLPNLAWDPADVRSLHCLAIVQRRDVGSLRDLRVEHLPLLRRVWTEGRAAVSEAYGVPVDRLRAFVHYHPSFYHLHVHIGHVDVASPTVAPDRAHPLPDVIDHLERFGDAYFAGKTFTVALGQLDPLWPLFHG